MAGNLVFKQLHFYSSIKERTCIHASLRCVHFHPNFADFLFLRVELYQDVEMPVVMDLWDKLHIDICYSLN